MALLQSHKEEAGIGSNEGMIVIYFRDKAFIVLLIIDTDEVNILDV